MPARNLKINMQGEAVKELQDMLRKLGYSIGDRSGFFGASTRDAVLDIQRKNKLRATGGVNSQTITALNKMISATKTNKSSVDRGGRKYLLGNEKKVIGKRLRGWRKEKGLKGYQAAKVIKISQGSLSDIENGKSFPSAPTIIKMMKKTDIDIYWLLGVKNTERWCE